MVWKQIFEAYYSYALNSSTKLTFDYQFIANPGYDAGPRPGQRLRWSRALAVLEW
jgi:hypothetical protein